jgi:hypothetical protein
MSEGARVEGLQLDGWFTGGMIMRAMFVNAAATSPPSPPAPLALMEHGSGSQSKRTFDDLL